MTTRTRLLLISAIMQLTGCGVLIILFRQHHPQAALEHLHILPLTLGVLSITLITTLTMLLVRRTLLPMEALIKRLGYVRINRHQGLPAVSELIDAETRELEPLVRVFHSLMEDLAQANRDLAESNRQLRIEQRHVDRLNETLERRVEAKTDEAMKTLQRLRAAESQLIRQGNSEAIDELVAGLAHEINTPLAIGTSTLASLQEDLQHLQQLDGSHDECRACLELKDNMQTSLNLALDNLNRAADLVASFKQVSVDQLSEHIRQFELKDYLGSVVTSLKPYFRNYPVTVDLQVEDGLYLSMPPGLLAQIIINLMVNAINHAYDEGESGTISIHAQPSAGQLAVIFSDDGKGMDDDTLSQLFDPFFTTRSQQGGSGLGAHVVYDLVVQRLGGSLRVNSEPGKGTEYRISFPCKMEKKHV